MEVTHNFLPMSFGNDISINESLIFADINIIIMLDFRSILSYFLNFPLACSCSLFGVYSPSFNNTRRQNKGNVWIENASAMTSSFLAMQLFSGGTKSKTSSERRKSSIPIRITTQTIKSSTLFDLIFRSGRIYSPKQTPYRQ